MVAEAFLASDERVRHAQSVLDAATAERSRILAAFSVTVGSDGAVAEMLGLNEREVRVTRRTVGKEDARAVAEQLLANASLQSAPAEQAAHGGHGGHGGPGVQHGQHGQGAQVVDEPVQVPGGAGGAGPMAGAAPFPPTTVLPVTGVGPDPEVIWSPTLDAVLVDAWQAQVDLSVLAKELGLDLARLTARANGCESGARP